MVDFRTARIGDPAWWRHCRLLFDELEREQETAAVEQAYALQLALISNGGITPEAFEPLLKATRESLNDLINLRLPWARRSSAARQEDERASLIELFRRAVGADQPDFQRKIADTVAFMRRRVEDPEQAQQQILQQMITERDRRRAERLQKARRQG